MKYFDTCYIVKCYLTEDGSDKVRKLTQKGEPIGSCSIAQLEFSAAVHRHLRQGLITQKEVVTLHRQFQKDIEKNYWTWLPLSEPMIEHASIFFQHLPKTVFLRSADALHLICAKNTGFDEIYSNDTHLLKAADYLGLKGIDVLANEAQP